MLIDEELFTTPVELSAGAMVVSGITVSQPAAEPGAERSWVRRHPGLLIIVGMGVGLLLLGYVEFAGAG